MIVRKIYTMTCDSLTIDEGNNSPIKRVYADRTLYYTNDRNIHTSLSIILYRSLDTESERICCMIDEVDTPEQQITCKDFDEFKKHLVLLNDISQLSDIIKDFCRAIKLFK